MKHQKNRSSAGAPRGYSLPLVLVLIVLLAIAFATALTALRSSVAVTSDMIARRKAFYVCDGLSRDIAHIAQEYIATTGNVTSAGMQDFVCAKGGSAAGCTAGLPTLTPAGFTTEIFNVSLVGAPVPRPLPNGSFAGMNALQSDIALRVAAKKDGTEIRCDTQQTMTLGSVGMFQFFVFSDLKLAWYPQPESVIRGRMHVNGDVCVSSTDGGIYLQNLTAAGRTMSGRNAACGFRDDPGSKAWVWKGGTSCPDSTYPGSDPTKQPAVAGPTTGAPANNLVDPCFVELAGDGPNQNDHGVIPPTAVGFSTWADYALATWSRHLLDVDHKVRVLKLPVQGSAQVQLSRLASGASATATPFSNASTSRLFIDPVIAGEPTPVSQEKLACQSDLRIINGVWFLKTATPTAADPCDWPGTPIWSDHPGRFTLTAAAQPTERGLVRADLAVGQADLRAARGWDATTNAEQIPKFFSYYRFGVLPDSSYGEMIYDTAQLSPVVSYGMMKPTPHDHDGDGTVDADVVPAIWADAVPFIAASPSVEDLRAGSQSSDVCGAALPSVAAATAGSGSAGDHGAHLSVFAGSCGGTAPPLVRHKLLDAARNGFLDPQLMAEPSYEPSVTRLQRSRVLPLNFDVRAFRRALKVCTKGELGSYFPATCNGTGTRAFNGIVYITNTWNSSLAGFGATVGSPVFAGGADVWPFQGRHQNSLLGLSLPGAVLGPAAELSRQPSQASRLTSAVPAPALPYELCTNDPELVVQTAGPVLRAGVGTLWQAEMVRRPTPAALGIVSFKHVRCSDWNAAVVEGGARANVVRVVHADVIGFDNVAGDPLRKGLTLATNIPAYLWGNVNTASTPSLLPVANPPSPWVPFLIASDQTRFLSAAWNDGTTAWGRPSMANHGGTTGGLPAKWVRAAVSTTYNLQNFSGHPQGAGSEFSGGFENFPGFLEDWDGDDATVNGSFVVGFSPVYLRWTHGGRKTTPPNRPWSYDHHLDFPANQPPGAPHFEVFAIKDWLR